VGSSIFESGNPVCLIQHHETLAAIPLGGGDRRLAAAAVTQLAQHAWAANWQPFFVEGSFAILLLLARLLSRMLVKSSNRVDS